MTFFKFAAVSGIALSFMGLPAVAGPCTQQIADAQASFDAKLNASAQTGPAAAQSTSATLHRQPTPGSVARAEENLGELSPENTRDFEAAMTTARDADAAGDREACERAIGTSVSASP